MKTYSRDIISANDINDLVQEHSIKDDSKLLIQLFCGASDITLIHSFQEYFKVNFPKATLVGSTSDGIIDADSVHIKDTSLVVFLFFKYTTLKSLIMDHDDSYHDYFKSGYMLASHLISHDTKVLITFSDGTHTNGEEYIKGINSFSGNTTISGGMAGDNGALSKTYVFDKDYASSNGAIAVALNSDVLEVTTNYSFDWMPIGKQLSVTKSIDNRVYEIDGMSAVELYSKYLGEELASLLPQVGIEYPLIVERNGIDTARAVLFKHDDGSLTFAGNVLEGERIRFGIGNVETILRGGDNNLRSIIEKSKNTIESFFIYSCMARRRFMGSHIEKELRAFADIAPTSGFFTYGEFFHSKNNNQLLNESMTVLALSESEEKIDIKLDNALIHQHHFSANPLHIISHLTNTISHELENLNNTLESRIKRNTDIIYKQAYFDKLTNLPNRLKLINDLSQHIKSDLILINIDEFNLVNDFYGHSTGDSVLKDFACVLEVFSVQESAIAYKLPADEFALILEKHYSTKELEVLVYKLIQTLTNHYISNKYHQIRVDVSASSSKVIGDGSGLANANMALKLAKRKNISYLAFDKSLMLSKSHETNLNMATTIRDAINNDTIISYYQPIYNAKTKIIDKYECLVRLRRDNDEILGPYSFLEISQKIKLYPQITKIMIDKTFTYFCKNGCKFSINLSFEDISNKQTRDYLFIKIEEFKIAEQLTIEILENQEMQNQEEIRYFIDKIYGLGANIAIDDFGSGFANFQHIANIKADYLKIDGSLIKNIDTDENSRLIVETIVIFAKKLGMKTVAEFVHSKEVYDVVCTLNIDLLQGYYLDMPLREI
ncbi:MAG: EAL domain-containing protein [Sulfurimonas sp.]|nr:EAL domain-containing protein [Sulfurimonas sp.]MDQ7061139.1 EAL domain-containing protein [Sulfurimonas sp.]